MTETQTIVLANLDANGGDCDWETALTGLDYPQRQTAFAEVRALQKEGYLQRVVEKRSGDSKPRLYLVKVTN